MSYMTRIVPCFIYQDNQKIYLNKNWQVRSSSIPNLLRLIKFVNYQGHLTDAIKFISNRPLDFSLVSVKEPTQPKVWADVWTLKRQVILHTLSRLLTRESFGLELWMQHGRYSYMMLNIPLKMRGLDDSNSWLLYNVGF